MGVVDDRDSQYSNKIEWAQTTGFRKPQDGRGGVIADFEVFTTSSSSLTAAQLKEKLMRAVVAGTVAGLEINLYEDYDSVTTSKELL